MNEPLRNGVWSLLKVYCWDHHEHYPLRSDTLRILCEELWFTYFKKPLDELSNDWFNVFGELRKYFFGCEWFEVYDFIEFVGNKYARYKFKERFMKSCNRLLEEEISAYRFVGG